MRMHKTDSPSRLSPPQDYAGQDVNNDLQIQVDLQVQTFYRCCQIALPLVLALAPHSLQAWGSI